MKYEEDIEKEIAKGNLNKQLNDALLAITQTLDTQLANRLLYDISLCHIGGGYLNYRKKFLYSLCLSNPQVANCMDSLNFIGYLLADKLDQNNLIQEVINNVCYKNKIKTLKEIDELKQNIKLIIREQFVKLIQEHKNEREKARGSLSDSDSSLSSCYTNESPRPRI